MRSLLISAALLMAIASTARGQATGAIRGTVLLPGGASAPSAVVSLRGTIAYRVTADSAGRFLLTAVLEGRYLLVAALGGNNPGTRSVKIRAGDTLEVTITLGGPVELQELTVRGLRPLSYAADSGSTGARMPVPIRDLPQTVTVVTREVVHDRNITTTRALAENVSGVTPYAGYDGYGLNEQGYIIRGMATSYTSTTLRDGFKDFAGVGPRDLANVERVEFLKGPSSVLYGATGALGGVPNTITRKPTRTRVAEVTLSDDRFGFGRGTLDLGGPVTRDSSVRYRLIAAGERSRNFRPFNAGSYGLSVSPSLELSLGARTELRISGEYTRRRYRSDPFFPHDSVSLSLPVDRYLGEPGLGLATARGFVAQAVLEHRFALGIRLRQGLSILGGRQNHQGAGIGSLIAPDTLERWASITRERSTDYASQTDLLLDGRRLGVRHRALVGVEVSRQVYSIFFTNDGLDPINIRNPTYGAHRIPGDTVDGRHPEDQLGIYVQDLVDLGSRVKLMVGARFDVNRTRQFVVWPALGLSGVVAEQTTRHLTPRAGLVYQPSGSLSIYGGWSRSFFPNLTDPANPIYYPPEFGEQFEVGVREEAAGGRLTATVAVYQLKKRHVLEAIPGDSLQRSALSGEQRSRGVEVDVQGSPADGINLVFTYAYTDARQTSSADTTLPNGRLAGAPRHAASLWSTYRVRSGALRGLKMGGGVYLWGNTTATVPATVELPAWQRVDLLLGYEWGRWGINLNLDNMTDEKYFRGDWQGIAPQAPRTLSGSISARL